VTSTPMSSARIDPRSNALARAICASGDTLVSRIGRGGTGTVRLASRTDRRFEGRALPAA